MPAETALATTHDLPGGYLPSCQGKPHHNDLAGFLPAGRMGWGVSIFGQRSSPDPFTPNRRSPRVFSILEGGLPALRPSPERV
jgi:hypothetical protein